MSKLDFVRVKGVALPVKDLERARKFYSGVLGLKQAGEDGPPDAFELGEAFLMLKAE
jgi:catechol 2,3-dioxygenase-like lactoylglutathione lyase family enzyme